MKQLKAQFISGEGGFSANPLTYTQITRNENYAIYQRSRDGVVKDYEVFKIRKFKQGQVNWGKTYQEDEEDYAVTSSFGKSAWSFGNLTSAQNKFNDLTNGAAVVDETIESYDSESPTVASEGKRGRTAKVRAPITYPSTPTWSVKDILTINLDYDQPTISLFLKKQIQDKKVALVGHVEKAEGQRGKAPNLYSLV